MRRSLFAIAGMWIAGAASVQQGADTAGAATQLITWGQIGSPPASATNVVAVVGGDYHLVALRADGTVVAWGSDGSGQTDVPPDATNVVAIAAGSTHSLAVRADGTVKIWGHILLSGVNTVPVEATNVTALGAGPGAQHAFALRSYGTVLDWGNVGDGVANIPATATNVIAIAAGSHHCVAVRGNGSVITWGQTVGIVPTGPNEATNVVAVAAGFRHDLALRADRKVIAWGDNTDGQSSVPAAATNVVAVACGSYQSLALRADGRLVSWGYSFASPDLSGSLSNVVGIGGFSFGAAAIIATDGPPVLAPFSSIQTVLPGGTARLRISAVGMWPLTYQWMFNGTNVPNGTNATLVLTNVQVSQSGAYVMSVSNVFGAVTSSPLALVLVPFYLTNQPQSQWAAAGLTANFGVGAMGQGPFNYQWQMNGANLSGATTNPLVLANVQTADQGAYSVLVSNSFGSVGSSAATLTVVPIVVTMQPQNQTMFRWGKVSLSVGAQAAAPLNYQWRFNGTNLPGATSNTLILPNLQISQAGAYGVALSAGLDATNSTDAAVSVEPVAAWGLGGYDQASVPVDFRNVLAISAGTLHTLVLLADGTVTAWGDNGAGQTTVPPGLTNGVAIAACSGDSMVLRADGTVMVWGDNSVGQTNVPGDLTNAVAIASGQAYCMALRSDGTVEAWGDNSYGQTNIPTGLANVVAISSHLQHNLALIADGTVVSWGRNDQGQTNVPSGLSNIVAVAAGGLHSLALRSDGTVTGWGYNGYGQVNIPANCINVLAIAGGDNHSLAVKGDGSVVGWGYPYDGQVAIPTELKNVLEVAGSDHFSVAVVGDAPPLPPGPLANPAYRTNSFAVAVPSLSGRTYRLEDKTNLGAANWIALPLAAGNGGMLILSDPSASSRERFYRVRHW